MWLQIRSLRLSRRRLAYAFLLSTAVFAVVTAVSVHPIVSEFRSLRNNIPAQALLDRNGTPLTITYQGRWNGSDFVPLHEIPPLLKNGFLLSEDSEFYQHHGVDWSSRLAALWQNIKVARVVRGASTITEQTVRMMYPRPRSLWAKWVEGVEATYLETGVGKADILEFYLNQVPYAANRRGVAQAARYYFNRDISTLTPRETLALIVLARGKG